jgi:hypothetical protein
MRSCSRGHYYKFGLWWLNAYGHVKEASQAGLRKVVVWLAERPVRWGGAWGIRCHMFAYVAARTVAGSPAESQGGASRRRQGTAWARFEVHGSSLQAEHIIQHKDQDVHKLAVLAWLRPDEPVQLKLQASLSDDQLLSGSVPQREDWLRAWRVARTPQSWKAAAYVKHGAFHPQYSRPQCRKPPVGEHVPDHSGSSANQKAQDIEAKFCLHIMS